LVQGSSNRWIKGGIGSEGGRRDKLCKKIGYVYRREALPKKGNRAGSGGGEGDYWRSSFTKDVPRELCQLAAAPANRPIRPPNRWLGPGRTPWRGNLELVGDTSTEKKGFTSGQEQENNPGDY